MSISPLIRKKIKTEYDPYEVLDLLIERFDGQFQCMIDYIADRDWGGLPYGYTGDKDDEIKHLRQKLKNVGVRVAMPASLGEQMELDNRLAEYRETTL